MVYNLHPHLQRSRIRELSYFNLYDKLACAGGAYAHTTQSRVKSFKADLANSKT